jgi:hypothetical protein
VRDTAWKYRAAVSNEGQIRDSKFFESYSNGQKKRFSNPEERELQSLKSLGKIWWNDGMHETRSVDCPGAYFVKGRISDRFVSIQHQGVY